jgi:spore maturation protein CgeB
MNSEQMVLLFVGPLQTPHKNTSHSRLDAICSMGITAHPICNIKPLEWGGKWGGYLFRRMRAGPPLQKLSSAILNAAEKYRPTHVWIDKGEWIPPKTIVTLQKKYLAKVVHYTPDPAFHTHKSRHFLNSLRLYDLAVTTKSYELDSYRQFGAKSCLRLHPSFDANVHLRKELSDEELIKYRSDIVFVGTHHESRYKYLESLAKADFDLAIRGVGWTTQCRSNVLKPFIKGDGIHGEEYAKAIVASKIGLGLLHKLHPDQSTTRSVEIPACETLLLTEKSGEHAELFVDGIDAVFFADPKELVTKASELLKDDVRRRAIALSGKVRVAAENCEVKRQMEMVFDYLDGRETE